MTTSLSRPVPDSRPRHPEAPAAENGNAVPDTESFEIIPPEQEPALTNGVPRNSWRRARRRISRWHRPYVLVLLILDYAAAALASLTAIAAFQQADAGFRTEATDEWFLPTAFVLLPLIWLIMLWANGTYDRRHLGLGTEEFKRVFRSSVAAAATVSFVAFATKVDLSRLSVATALATATTYIFILRALARRLLHLVRRRTGNAAHRTLLIGTLPEAVEICKAVARTPSAGLVPVGIHLTDGYGAARGLLTPVPVFPARRDILPLVKELRADTIAVCGSASAEPGELRRLAWQLEGTGVDLVVAPQLTDIAGPRVHVRPIEGLPLLHVEEPTLSGLAWLGKNLMDRAASATGLLLLAPLFAVVAVAIKLSDPGPVFFRQARVGREGSTFWVWKFRTMYTDAEERRAALLDQNESDGQLFKIKKDPRIFPLGRLLRKTSVDELPQLINVLRGEMSLVGPRPLPADDGDYLGDVRRRLLVRPGITGLWQVSGRSDLSWDEAVRLDLYYVDNWSFAYDLSILWRTVSVVVGRKGAY
jgi:exopolysaccharide biosynthesis polyprenyl glycosylphosphotransferase